MYLPGLKSVIVLPFIYLFFYFRNEHNFNIWRLEVYLFISLVESGKMFKISKMVFTCIANKDIAIKIKIFSTSLVMFSS